MKNATTSSLFAVGAAAALLLVSSAPAAAQEDARWLPLVGCWVPVDGSVEAAATDQNEELLCVSTNAQGGVDMRSYEGSELLGTVTMVANGQPRSVERDGCRGTETAAFSSDRRYISVETNYTCEGQVGGRTSGLIAMVTPFEWINAQVVEASEGEVAGVMRYTLASRSAMERAGLESVSEDREQAVRRARIAASRPLEIDDLIAANGAVHPQALQAWVVEQGDLRPVNADELVRMADMGVAEDVIDMVVAVSHPSTFAIAQGGTEPLEDDRYDRRRRSLGFFPGSFGYLGWTRYNGYGYYGFSPYAYNSLYGYGRYGGYGYGYWGYSPTVVIQRGTVTSNRGGRAVNGRGYRRSGGSDTGRTAGVRSSGGSSGGSSARAQPRAGSSSRGTARTAKPRTAKRRPGGF